MDTSAATIAPLSEQSAHIARHDIFYAVLTCMIHQRTASTLHTEPDLLGLRPEAVRLQLVVALESLQLFAQRTEQQIVISGADRAVAVGGWVAEVGDGQEGGSFGT